MPLLFAITWGTTSGWWTLACLLLGGLYAWAMYRQPLNIAPRLRNLLAALRVTAVSIIAFLLVSPMVKTSSYQPQKPLVIIAQDNSASNTLFKPAGFNQQQFINQLLSLKKTLGDDYDVQEFNFDGNLHNGLSTTFNGKQTDISAALRQINERFVNQNIGAIVLATDGLYNRGTDPQYEAKNIKSAIYTIALGDTTIHRDLLIGNVNYNKTAFLGNEFEVEVLTAAYQSHGESIRLNVTEDGRPVTSEQALVSSNSFKKNINLKLHADKKGIHKFTFSIAPVKNEISLQNNTETVYIELLDARQKILLLYNSPHPDITVIKQAIESNHNFELQTQQAASTAIKWEDYSLVILYQPNAHIINQINRIKTPLWFITGLQTDLPAFNNAQKLLTINSARAETQEVFAQPSADFSLFTLSDSTMQKLGKLPPLLLTYGTYNTAAGAAVLLKQKIGSVATPYPLMLFADEGGRREAVLAAEGLWRWQLAEFQIYGNHHAVEELLTQSVQYLTANANQQRFRVYPSKNVFDEGENILLNAELYNDALELVNTPDVKIELSNDKGKRYSFLFSRNGQSYRLDAGLLPVGEYSYTANTKLGNKALLAHGRFTIKALNLEARQSTANHQLLSSLAKQTGGVMLLPNELEQLSKLIRKNENIKTVVYEDKHYTDLIELKWVFVLILLLLSAEWFIRKREGI